MSDLGKREGDKGLEGEVVKKRQREDEGNDVPDSRDERAAKRLDRASTVVELFAQQVATQLVAPPSHCVYSGFQTALHHVDPSPGGAPLPPAVPRRPGGPRHRELHTGGHSLRYLLALHSSLQDPDSKVFGGSSDVDAAISTSPAGVIDQSEYEAWLAVPVEDEDKDEDGDSDAKSEPDGGGSTDKDESEEETYKEGHSIDCPSCDGGVAPELLDAYEEEIAGGIASANYIAPLLEDSGDSTDGGADPAN